MPPIKVFSDAPLHPDGVTPKTAQPEQSQPDAIPEPTKTTALTPTDPSAPPPPQPGARPQPGPAPTSTASSSAPPPPQPGAIPHVPTVTATHTTTNTGYVQPPRQMTIPPPTANHAPTHSTYVPQASPYEAGATAQPAPVTGGLFGQRRPSLEHPPGYQQNPLAADGTASERARFEEANIRASEEEGVMGTVRNYLATAGKKLENLESEAWKLAKGK